MVMSHKKSSKSSSKNSSELMTLTLKLALRIGLDPKDENFPHELKKLLSEHTNPSSIQQDLAQKIYGTVEDLETHFLKVIANINSKDIININQLSEKNKDILVGKVNVDKEPELARKFGIRSIPIVIYFKNGEVTEKDVGAKPLQGYQDKLDKVKGV